MRPRKQHYVPRFYLEGFADKAESQRRRNPCVWVYERGKPPRPSAVEKAAAERDFYEYKEFRPGLPDFEKMFSKIESELAPTFLRIEDPTYRLDANERFSLAVFAAFSFFRTPAGRAMLDATFGKAAKAIQRGRARNKEQFARDWERSGGDPARAEAVRDFILSGKYKIEQASKGYNLQAVLQAVLDVAPVLNELGWTRLYPPKPYHFITSDSPVFAVVPPARPGEPAQFGCGFGVRGAQVHFPLSARCCLVMEAGEEDLWGIASEVDMRNCNRGQFWGARRFLFASERSVDLAADFDREGGEVNYGENAMSLSLEKAKEITDRVYDRAEQEESEST